MNPQGLRAQPGARLALGMVAGMLTVLAALQGVAQPVAAAPANQLLNGAVQPASGTSATLFVFSVRYESGQGNEPTSVSAVAGNVVIPLALATGSAADGRYRGSAQLPAGTWDVVFQAAARGNDPSLEGPSLTVASAPPATPKPTPRPKPTPTARPRPAPTSAPTAAQPSAAPQTTVPRTPRPRSHAPRATPDPASGSPSPSARGSGLVLGGVATPKPQESLDPAFGGGALGPSSLITVITGTLVALGALGVIGLFAFLAARRRRRRPDTRLELLPDEARELPAAEAKAAATPRRPTSWERDWALDEAPIGSVEYRPPPSEEGG